MTTNDELPIPDAVPSKWQQFRHYLYRRIHILILLGIVLSIGTVMLWSRIVTVIEAGEGGVLFRPLGGGVETDRVYTEGVHIIWPIDTMTHYDARVQIILHSFDVLTNRGLPVTLTLAVRYKPIFELLGLLHQKVGPDYPNKIILPQIESVLRKGLGTHSPEEIYTNKDMLLSKLIARAIEEVGRKYVIVDDVIIRSVTLPEEVRRAIEAKLVEEQRLLTYDFRLKTAAQEAERKRIESRGIRDYAANINATMSENVLRWHGVQATKELAASPNSKLVLIGGGKDGLPLILNAGDWGKESFSQKKMNSSKKHVSTNRTHQKSSVAVLKTSPTGEKNHE